MVVLKVELLINILIYLLRRNALAKGKETSVYVMSMTTSILTSMSVYPYVNPYVYDYFSV